MGEGRHTRMGWERVGAITIVRGSEAVHLLAECLHFLISFPPLLNVVCLYILSEEYAFKSFCLVLGPRITIFFFSLILYFASSAFVSDYLEVTHV